MGILLFLLVIVSRPELIESSDVISPQQAVGTLIVSAMLLILIQFHRTNQRLREVLRVANAIGRGVYGVRSKVKGSDHIGRLSYATNLMAAKIGATIEELEESQEKLEESQADLEEQNRELSDSVGIRKKFGEFLSRISSIEINVIANATLDSVIEISNCQVGISTFSTSRVVNSIPSASGAWTSLSSEILPAQTQTPWRGCLVK